MITEEESSDAIEIIGLALFVAILYHFYPSFAVFFITLFILARQ